MAIPMAAYTGNVAYCFSNGLHLSLLNSGADPSAVPEPGFVECLTGMPFGKTYNQKGPAFWPSAPGFSPEKGGGLDLAVETLGWKCETWHAGAVEAEPAGVGAAAEALTRLRDGLRHGPVLVGPVNFGYLSYSPHARQMAGADHYVVALAMESDHLVLHYPAGVPYGVLPIADLLDAWRAERVGYKRGAYTLRSCFRQTQRVSRQEMIQRTIPHARRNANADPGGPATYGGGAALARLARDLRREVSAALERRLLGFAFPTAARRTVDAARFLAEGGRADAAEVAWRLAVLWGRACSAAARRRWADTADVVDQLAAVERELAAVL